MRPAATINKETGRPDALEVFRERAEARATLCANGLMELQTAVDELWAAAERDGLVKAHGADDVQWILSEAFGRWRLRDDG
jgi:hypothetical protein